MSHSESPSTNKEDFIVYKHELQHAPPTEIGRFPDHWGALDHMDQARCAMFTVSLVYRNNETGERTTLVHP